MPAELLQPEAHRRFQHTQPVDRAPRKTDGRGVLKILGRTANLPDREAEVNDLRKHLVVENKVIGVLQQGNCFQHLPGEGPG